MKVIGIANSPYFGYNKELNEKVNNRLRNPRGNKETAQALLDLNLFCMRTEDKINKAEKEHKPDVAEYYGGLIADAKITAVNNINDRFRDLNYREKELNWYKREIKNRGIEPTDQYDWRVQIIDGLEESKQIDIEVNEAIATAKKEGTYFGDDVPEPQNAPQTEAPKQVNQTQEAVNKKVDPKELVELFVPKNIRLKGL